MIDLKNMGTGRKLIQKAIKNDSTSSKPWSLRKINENHKKIKNTRHTKK